MAKEPADFASAIDGDIHEIRVIRQLCIGPSGQWLCCFQQATLAPSDRIKWRG